MGIFKNKKTKEGIMKKNMILMIYSLLTLILLVGVPLSESKQLIGCLMANIGVLGIIGILIYSFQEKIKKELKRIVSNPLCLSFFMIFWGILIVIIPVLKYNAYPNAHHSFNGIILLGIIITYCGFLMTLVIITPQKTISKILK